MSTKDDIWFGLKEHWPKDQCSWIAISEYGQSHEIMPHASLRIIVRNYFRLGHLPIRAQQASWSQHMLHQLVGDLVHYIEHHDWLEVSKSIILPQNEELQIYCHAPTHDQIVRILAAILRSTNIHLQPSTEHGKINLQTTIS